ncbi:dUTP diphosphatase [Planococcus faecalis]|uniref:dUTPase n=1 Tax=Planococcus faecalis TaxID=1598147 RepID=A0ABM6ITU1_9BACL|nr:dUTP diphosphatase [Planococcus faecalis]AQU79745.1 hypothetical protein AJGP001_10920 [Planococcus faecalis]OHX52059.1 hypothetical protein BB777_14100 [Planococcus faecalis]
MNLDKLFEVQRGLDAEIEKNHPTAADEDRLAKRILALQVELGECANEWRGFKFWSANQEARTKVPTTLPTPKNWNVDTVERKYKNPLLEEYVDCLHFILSIGLHLGFEGRSIARLKTLPQYSLIDQFLEVANDVLELYYALDFRGYENLMTSFVILGEMLGFTWEQIETAYMKKNQINYQRQDTGYLYE